MAKYARTVCFIKPVFNSCMFQRLKKSHILISCCTGREFNENSAVENRNETNMSKHFLKQTINNVVLWYEELTGLDEVKLMQTRVIEAQNRFIAAQIKRKDASKALLDIQNELKELNAELQATTRGEERYLQLITQEHAVLKEVRRLTTDFHIFEREERESFALFTSAVKESHEKERAQAERTKYWSIIGSVIGTIIGIVGSSVNNEFKMKELRNLVKESTRGSYGSGEQNLLSQHEEKHSSIKDEMKSIGNHSKNLQTSFEESILNRLDELLQRVNNVEAMETESEKIVTESIKQLDRSVEEVKHVLNEVKNDGQLMALPSNMEALIYQQRKETKIVLIFVTLVGVIVPVIVNYVHNLS